MLTAATWSARLGTCLLAAILTFANSPTSGANLAVEIGAFLLSSAVIGYWLLTEKRLLSRHPGRLEIGLGAMAAVAGVAFLAPKGTALIGFCVIAVLAAGANTSPTSGWLIGLTAILAVEIGAIVYDAGAGSVVGYPLMLIACFIGGRNRRAYQVQSEQAAELLDQVEQLRSEQRRVAVLDERSRIAREIHDVLAHSLGALGIQIQTVRAVLTDNRDVDRALSLLDQAHRLAAGGLVETRRAVQALRGDSIHLDAQLAALVETHRERHSTQVELAINGAPASLVAEATIALIRIAQEALVNAAKHAPAQPVRVHLHYQPDHVRLKISNPMPRASSAGVQRPAVLTSVNGGFGLIGMRERLLLIRGSLDSGVENDAWRVEAVVPR